MTDHTTTPWKWHPMCARDERNGSIYSEQRPGHAYAVAMQPRYVENEQWSADAAFIVNACNAHETLVQFAEFIRDGYERGDISHVEFRVQAFRAALDVLATIDTPALTSATRGTVEGEK